MQRSGSRRTVRTARFYALAAEVTEQKGCGVDSLSH